LSVAFFGIGSPQIGSGSCRYPVLNQRFAGGLRRRHGLPQRAVDFSPVLY
jgi:hypothetical protein